MTMVTQAQFNRFKMSGIDVSGLKIYPKLKPNISEPIYSGPPRNRSERRATRSAIGVTK